MTRRGMTGGVWLLCASLAVVMALASPPPTARARMMMPPRVRIRAHVVAPNGAPIRDDAWLNEQVREAARAFFPANLRFELESSTPLDGGYMRVDSRRERTSLGALAGDGSVDVFVVHTLADAPSPTSPPIDGVHWRGHGQHYVILSAFCRPDTLAHELGHYFGLRHARTATLMNQERPARANFSPDEVARVRRTANRLLYREHLLR